MNNEQLSLNELAEKYQLPLRTIQHLFYRRTDRPEPVGKRTNPSGGVSTPLFNLNEFDAYLQELGIIPKKLHGDQINMLEVAELLEISFTRTKELLRADPKFPKTLTNKKFYRRFRHYVFIRSEIMEYKAARRKKKGAIKISKREPISVSDNLNANIRQFLNSPSDRIRRATTNGHAQTVRVRTEGVVGIW